MFLCYLCPDNFAVLSGRRSIGSLSAIFADRVNYLLDYLRERIPSFIVGETLAAGYDQRMRSRGQADGDPGNLANVSSSFKLRSHRCRHEFGRYTGADGPGKTFGTCP